MKQIGDSNEDMLALLEAVVGIKNELLYIREYFHPLLKGEIYLTGEQVCQMLHISKRTLQQYRDDGLIPFIKLERKILFREAILSRYWKTTISVSRLSETVTISVN